MTPRFIRHTDTAARRANDEALTTLILYPTRRRSIHAEPVTNAPRTACDGRGADPKELHSNEHRPA